MGRLCLSRALLYVSHPHPKPCITKLFSLLDSAHPLLLKPGAFICSPRTVGCNGSVTAKSYWYTGKSQDQAGKVPIWRDKAHLWLSCYCVQSRSKTLRDFEDGNGDVLMLYDMAVKCKLFLWREQKESEEEEPFLSRNIWQVPKVQVIRQKRRLSTYRQKKERRSLRIHSNNHLT
jgi:hypothetical protein